MNYGFSWLIELHSGGLSSDCCRSTLDENTNLFASVFVAVHMSKILISFKNCICICSSRILSCHWLVIVMIDCRGIFLVVYSTRRRSKLWSAVLGFNGTTNHHYQLCHILKNQYSYKFTFKSSLSRMKRNHCGLILHACILLVKLMSLFSVNFVFSIFRCENMKIKHDAGRQRLWRIVVRSVSGLKTKHVTCEQAAAAI